MTAPRPTAEYGFGPWLQWWRLERRWTQRQLADKLGFGLSYLRKLESGVRAPSDAVLLAIGALSGLPAEAMTAVPSRRAPVPVPLTSLVGREASASAIVAELLASPGLLTLTGAAGVGKTRLAIESATRLDPVIEHGVWWVSLADETDSRRLAATIVEALGLADASRRGPTDRLHDFLRGQEGCLVLDNVEQLVPDANATVARLLAEAPRLRILVTSRQPLGIRGERRYPVDPLAFPAPQAGVSPSRIADWPAVSLFVDRARSVDPAFRLTAANAGVVARVCALLDGIPLGIELAATNTGALSAEEIVDWLQEGRRLPVGAPLDAPARHQTLTAAIDWSYRELADDLQVLLTRLSVFVGGCRPEAVAAVCGSPEDGLDETTARLACLAAKSLLVARPEVAGGIRYEMLGMIRSFASERLQERSEIAEMKRRHGAYFAALSEMASPELVHDDQARWLTALEHERANLDAALDWALEHDPSTALAMSGALWRAYFLRARFDEGRARLGAALAATADDDPARPRALNGAVVLARSQGDFAEASRLCDAAYAAALAAGRADEAAVAIMNQGIIHENQRDFARAEDRFADALQAYEALGDRRGQAMVVNNLGMVALERDDDVRGAEELFERSLALLGERDHYGRGLLTGNLGFVALRQDRFAAARAWYRQSLRHADAIADERGVAYRLSDLARLAAGQGNPGEAIGRAVDALTLFQRMGDLRGAAECFEGLGTIAARGDNPEPELAALLLGKADALRQHIRAPLCQSEQDVHDRLTGDLRARLRDDGSFDDLFAAGRAMSVEDLLAQSRPRLRRPAGRRNPVRG